MGMTSAQLAYFHDIQAEMLNQGYLPSLLPNLTVQLL